MIALINFNTYLGGGETLFVRLAEYFEKKCPELLLFYKSESYIESDIKRKVLIRNIVVLLIFQLIIIILMMQREKI